MPSWEYLLVEIEKNTHSGEWEIEKANGQSVATYPPIALHDRLKQLGIDEWELVSDSPTGTTRREMIFKRPKR